MTIGEKIRKHRKEIGLTQKALADAAGIAEITVRQYESGRYKPRAENIVSISNALQVPYSYFLDDEQAEPLNGILETKTVDNDYQERLQRILDDAADEIRTNGLDSLWHPEQYILGAKIILEINENMIPTLRYEKEVYPKPRKRDGDSSFTEEASNE